MTRHQHGPSDLVTSEIYCSCFLENKNTNKNNKKVLKKIEKFDENFKKHLTIMVIRVYNFIHSLYLKCKKTLTKLQFMSHFLELSLSFHCLSFFSALLKTGRKLFSHSLQIQISNTNKQGRLSLQIQLYQSQDQQNLVIY